MEYRFVKGQGVVDDRNIVIAPFDLRVNRIIKYSTCADKISSMVYEVVLITADGEEKMPYQVKELSWEKINVFTFWQEPDALLGKKEWRIMLHRLQYSATRAKQVEVHLALQGLNVYQGISFYIMGKRGITCSKEKPDVQVRFKGEVVEVDWQTESSFAIRDSDRMLLQDALNVNPPLSSAMLYIGLLGVFKSFLQETGRLAGFSILVAGEPGVTKTSLASKYAIYGHEEQKVNFSYEVLSINDETDRMSLFRGSALLYDDFHTLDLCQ